MKEILCSGKDNGCCSQTCIRYEFSSVHSCAYLLSFNTKTSCEAIVAVRGFFVSPISFFNQRSRNLYVVVFALSSLFERVSFTISVCQLNSICFALLLRFKKQTTHSSFDDGSV